MNIFSKYRSPSLQALLLLCILGPLKGEGSAPVDSAPKQSRSALGKISLDQTNSQYNGAVVSIEGKPPCSLGELTGEQCSAEISGLAEVQFPKQYSGTVQLTGSQHRVAVGP
jgi:hypothetical protein